MNKNIERKSIIVPKRMAVQDYLLEILRLNGNPSEVTLVLPTEENLDHVVVKYDCKI